MRVSLLGPPRACSDDGAVDYCLPRKTLNVLAYLILHAKRPVNRDSIAFALFPDDDEDAARAHLRRNLSYLLSSLPPCDPGTPFVIANFEQLSWNARATADIDVYTFERAIAEGRDDDAIAAYAGELLPTLYDEWTVGERERLANLFNDALTRTISRERSLRRFGRAAELARRLLEDDPWREDIIRQLMAIRYESGDRAGALAVYERFSANLRHEMHAEPMPETEAIRVTILRGARLASSLSALHGASRDARGIADLFGACLDRLSPAAANALIYAAVIGSRFDLATLGTAMGWNDAELVDALGESIDLGLIRASTGTPVIAFVFTHHLAHQSALDRLSARDRKLAQALVARALAAAPGNGAVRAAFRSQRRRTRSGYGRGSSDAAGASGAPALSGEPASTSWR